MGKRYLHRLAYRQLAALLTMILSVHPATAQIDKILGQSANQQIVQMAVKDAVIVWRQSYRLRKNDDGNLYGRDNADEYGSSLSVAVKVKQGALVTDPTLHPWRYDKVFAEAGVERDFTPILHTSMFNGKSIQFASVMETAEPLNDSMLFLLKSEIEPFGEGLSIAQTGGEREGWIVWVTNDANQPYIINKKTIGLEPGKTVAVSPPSTERTLLGGIFVVTHCPTLGVVEFQLGGMVVSTDKAWEVIPVVGQLPKEEAVSTVDTPPDILPVGMTPIQDDPAPEIKTKPRKNKNKKDKQ